LGVKSGRYCQPVGPPAGARCARRKGGEIRMRTAKIKTEKQMIDLWEAYKDRCENVQVRVHDFSAKNSEFVSDTITKSIT
jgi:hypothetical protein